MIMMMMMMMLLLPLQCTVWKMKGAHSTYQNVRRYIIEIRNFETPKLYAVGIERGNTFSAFDRTLLDFSSRTVLVGKIITAKCCLT